ncbi:MAG: phosphoribosylformylglycinamidine cyclo-ligase [Acidobacteriota bacterium]|nr:MAG: phosphoribosylformylglycinamidine cyclo-ligase [Acidobacteriota bacterium]
MTEKTPSSKSNRPSLTYRDSGVDIDQANIAKKRIKTLARSTFGPSVISDIGAFAGLYRADFSEMNRPILVSSADGVGTKLKIAFLTGIHNTVGIDIVSHCTDNILVHGAIPLFFLDYIAAGKLEPHVIGEIVEGLAKGCLQSQCALIGGETAEMPDFYSPGEYDLAGFIVGVADEDKLFKPGQTQVGDHLIGLPSSGLHTNGYSLVRKLVFEQEGLTVDSYVDDLQKTIGEELLLPHRNYLPTVRPLIEQDCLRAIAHITGGGITENLDRILSASTDAQVKKGVWEINPIFQFIQDRGNVAEAEMYRTFNMGIGMILVVPDEKLDAVLGHLRKEKEIHYQIGQVIPGTGKVVYA